MQITRRQLEREVENLRAKFELEKQIWKSSAYKLQADKMGVGKIIEGGHIKQLENRTGANPWGTAIFEKN